MSHGNRSLVQEELAFSESTNALSDQVFGALQSRARSRTPAPAPLHVGDTHRSLPADLAQSCARIMEASGAFHYSAPAGIQETRAAFCAQLSRWMPGDLALRVCADDVVVTHGATGGLSVVCQALLNPGDEVLIPAPFWPLIRGIVRGRGANAVEVPMFDRLKNPDFNPVDAIEQKCTDRTRLLYLNTPHNPTGQVLSHATLRALLDMALARKLWVVLDLAYDGLIYSNPANRTPPEGNSALAVAMEHPAWGQVISCHTLSKSFGIAGARVGFVHGAARAMERLRSVMTFHSYCAPRPMQQVAALLLTRGQAWAADLREQNGMAAGEVSAWLRQWTGQSDVSVDAGTFAFFEVPAVARGECTLGAWLERCLDHGVLLTPGIACGEDYGNWARLCFTSVGPTQLTAALQSLAPLLA